METIAETPEFDAGQPIHSKKTKKKQKNNERNSVIQKPGTPKLGNLLGDGRGAAQQVASHRGTKKKQKKKKTR